MGRRRRGTADRVRSRARGAARSKRFSSGRHGARFLSVPSPAAARPGLLPNRGEAMQIESRGLMLNMATVDPAHEDEFNRWYHDQHIPDVLERFPQITRVRRYRATDAQEPRYLVVYEYDVADEDELNRL